MWRRLTGNETARGRLLHSGSGPKRLLGPRASATLCARSFHVLFFGRDTFSSKVLAELSQAKGLFI